MKFNLFTLGVVAVAALLVYLGYNYVAQNGNSLGLTSTTASLDAVIDNLTSTSNNFQGSIS